MLTRCLTSSVRAARRPAPLALALALAHPPAQGLSVAPRFASSSSSCVPSGHLKHFTGTKDKPTSRTNGWRGRWGALAGAALTAVAVGGTMAAAAEEDMESTTGVPIVKEGPKDEIREKSNMTFAPNVPPPITRKHAVTQVVEMTSEVVLANITNKYKYNLWTFNGGVPGPFIRARVGDTLEVHHLNKDQSGMPHNIDFHGVTGPGGGAGVTLSDINQTKMARFKMLYPGLYIYHCAAAPVPMHVANGMYGLLLVEPEEGMPPADKEFYVMQSEFYFDPPENGGTVIDEISYSQGLKEEPEVVCFNGREGSLTQGGVLKSKVGDKVRIYFGNAGPNLISSFHVIGSVFDKVYRDADLVSPPARYVQMANVNPGSATVVEMNMVVPGNYTLVDHAVFRFDKGAIGFLNVEGPPRPDIYASREMPENCPGCKLHA